MSLRYTALTDKTSIKIGDAVKIITYLIGMAGFASNLRHINYGYSFLFIALSALSVYFERTGKFPIPRWVLNICSLAVLFISFYRLNLDNIVVPALEGLLLLLSIKFLQEKKFRDFMQIYTIAVFLLSGSSLLSIDMEFLLYFLALLFMLGIAIVLLAYYAQNPALELPGDTVLKIILNSLLIPLISIPLTLFIFIILPRTNYPLFKFLNRAEKAQSGFADKVRLGEVSAIQEDSSIIFRARMPRLDNEVLYWRGIVLDYYDGKSWSNLQGDTPVQVHLSGRRVEQTIYLEPYENKYLFALDKPLHIALRNTIVHNDLTVSLPQNIRRKLRYEAVSVISEVIPEYGIDEDKYLQLPEGLSRKTIDLVSRLIRGKRSDTEEAIRTLLKFLREGDYKYSFRSLPITQEPLEAFLFKYKYGNCEYFASAMAVMLRLAHIPSRLVGGYMGGYYNEVGGYYIIPQKNAHVWVETYVKGMGWIRLDPTPVSAADFSSEGRNFFQRARLLLDSIDYYWTVFIVNYDFEKQTTLLMKIRSGINKPKIDLKGLTIEKEKLIPYAAGLLFIAGTGFLIYALIFRRRKEEEILLTLFFRRLGKYGYHKQKSQGLEEFAAGIRDEGLRLSAYKFIEEFQRHFYRDAGFTREDIKILRGLIMAVKSGNAD